MSRIFNLTRNVASSLLRSSVRENDQPTSRLIPRNQFLFWFNEIPGHFSPAPRNFLSLEGVCGTVHDKSLAPCVDFSRHKDDNPKFEVGSLSYIRAVHYGALLAVGYTILHNKLLSSIVKETCQSYCPIVSIKHQKTVWAQPLSSSAVRRSHTDDKQVNPEDFSTSDYSSTKSDFESPPEFTKEEEEIMNLEKQIPEKIQVLSRALSNVKTGHPDGMKELEELANGGCPIGLFYLGQVYQHGIRTKINLKKARKLYEEAANRGSAEAKYNLGLIYLRGEAEEESRLRGLRLVREAAGEGVTEARESLGINKQERVEAENFSEADLDELVRLGMVLEENKLSDPEDKYIALDYYRVASEHGHKSAQIRMKKLSRSLKSQHS